MTPEVVDKICVRLASGESLRSICSHPDMPVMSTVLLAVVQDRDGFSERYHDAREAAGYAHADSVLEAVDEARSGEMEPQQAKAVMYGLMWAAERMSPNRHSSRQVHDHRSGDRSMSPPQRIELVAVDATPPDETD